MTLFNLLLLVDLVCMHGSECDRNASVFEEGMFNRCVVIIVIGAQMNGSVVRRVRKRVSNARDALIM